MKQKFITINELQLAYLEINEDKKPVLFFIHGNSVSSRSWQGQLNSVLLKDYHMIAIDLPAHGDSAVAINPAKDYSLPGLGLIVANAIITLAGLKDYILVGLSLGTNILAEALAFGLQPKGLVIAGSCLIGRGLMPETFIYPGTNVDVVFTEQASENRVKVYAKEVMINSGEQAKTIFLEDYYRVRPPFRSCLADSLQHQRFSDQLQLIKSVNQPALIVFGQDEQIINPDYLDDVPLCTWRDTIFKIPGASHLVHLDQPDAFNELLAAYANEMT